MKKLIAITLTIFMMLSIVPCIQAADVYFTRGSFCEKMVETFNLSADISEPPVISDLSKEDEYYQSIMVMLELGYMFVPDDNIFRSEQRMTKSEVAVLLTHILFGYGEIMPKDYTLPDDVHSSHWAKNCIWKVVDAELMHLDNGLFYPEADAKESDIDYEVAMTILGLNKEFNRGSFCAKMADILELDTDITGMETRFSDVSVDDEHYESIMIMTKLGYINGYEDGTFKPDNILTTGEVATLLVRMLFGELYSIPEDVDYEELYNHHWASKYIWKAENSGIMPYVTNWVASTYVSDLDYGVIDDIVKDGFPPEECIIDGGICGEKVFWKISSTGVLTISGTGDMIDYSTGKNNRVPWYSYIDNIKSVIVSDGVTSIGQSAFNGCANLTSVTLGNSVADLGWRAFGECTGLKRISLPAGITTIDEFAFLHCGNLEDIYITDLSAWCKISFGAGHGNPLSYAENLYINDVLAKEIIIPETTTEIKDYAFYGLDCLEKVVISDNVTTIGREPFDACESLKEIVIGKGVTDINSSAIPKNVKLSISDENMAYSFADNVLYNKNKTKLIKYFDDGITTSYTIPSTVTSIDEWAFEDCSTLLKVIIGDNLTSIGQYAFSYCMSITDVEIGKNVTTISGQAFYNCPNLKSIVIPDSVVTIGTDAFLSCKGLTSVTLGKNVKTIGSQSFLGCINLKEIKIPDSVTTIGWRAFESCINLEKVEMGTGVKYINERAFYGCNNLTSISVPNTVTTIGENAFANCSRLTDILVDEDNINYADVEGVLFDNSKTKLICYPAGKSNTTYTVPNDVTTICKDAFLNCINLTSITLSDKIDSIGETAFYDCASLTEINLPKTLNNIGQGAFVNCKKIQNISIPSSVKSIGEFAFENCGSIDTIIVPDGISEINMGCFSSCTKLKQICIPKSISNICQNAFDDCTNLTDIYYSGTQEEFNAITVNDSGNRYFENATVHYNFDFANKENLATITLTNYPRALTYGESFELIATVSDASTNTGVWTWEASDNDILEITATDNKATVKAIKPGKATITVQFLSDTDIGETISLPISVKKALVKVKASSKSIYVGGTIPSLTSPILNTDYTITGLVGEDTLTGAIVLTYNETPVNTMAKSYTITPSGLEADTNKYNIVFEAGTLTVSTKPSNPAPSGGGGGGAPTESKVDITVGNTTIKATVSGTTATISKIEPLPSTNKEVSIDFSGTGKSVDTAKLATSVVKEIAKSEGVEIKLSEATVSFDATALETISKELGNSQLILNVSKASDKSMNSSQKIAIRGLNNAKSYEISLKAGSKTISDFNGGKAEVEINVGKGQKGQVKIYYISDNGDITDIDATYDKNTGIAKSVLEHFSLYAITFDETVISVETPVFFDVGENDWFYNNVKYAVENKLMNGTAENKFAPNDTLTRAMLVTVLYRAEGEPAVNKSVPFADVDMDAYYAKAVSWAKQNGIVNGVLENKFAPDANITREQIAAIMHRYAQYKGYDVSVGENTNILSYDDFDSISEYAIASLQWACGSGLMKGKSTSTLNPLDNATRAEIAAILQRFIESN